MCILANLEEGAVATSKKCYLRERALRIKMVPFAELLNRVIVECSGQNYEKEYVSLLW